MKTLFLVLSTLWAVARKTPILLSLLWTLMRCTPAILQHLPAALVLIDKIRVVFGSEAVQGLLKAFHAFIDSTVPPAQAADGTGTSPENSKREQRRRFFQFTDRIKFARVFNEDTVRYVCDLHDRTVGSDSDDSGTAECQYA